MCAGCGPSSDGDAVVIDAPREDRERVCLGVAERAGLCALEPAPRRAAAR